MNRVEPGRMPLWEEICKVYNEGSDGTKYYNYNYVITEQDQCTSELPRIMKEQTELDCRTVPMRKRHETSGCKQGETSLNGQ